MLSQVIIFGFPVNKSHEKPKTNNAIFCLEMCSEPVWSPPKKAHTCVYRSHNSHFMSGQKLQYDIQGTLLTSVIRLQSEQMYKTISRALSVPRCTASSATVNWKKFGTSRTLPRLSCLTQLSNWTRRALVREVTRNPTVTQTELQKSSAEMGEPAGGTSQQHSIN